MSDQQFQDWEKDRDEYFDAIFENRKEYAKQKRIEKDKIVAEIKELTENLILDEQSITDLLLYCQSGHISCRKCAQLILKLIK